MHTERGSREYANLGRKSNMLMSSEHCGVKKAREKQKERERGTSHYIVASSPSPKPAGNSEVG